MGLAVPRPAAAAPRPVVARGARLHHGRRLGVELVDPYRHVAQDILVETQIALELMHRGRGRVEVEEDVVALAVLLDAVGERFESPELGLGDLAAVFLDDSGE